jgi:hypothetical protein
VDCFCLFWSAKNIAVPFTCPPSFAPFASAIFLADRRSSGPLSSANSVDLVVLCIMKTPRIVFVVSLVSEVLLAQDYYPLNVSNRWYFDSSATAVRVMADSLFSNGHHYSVLSRPDLVGGNYVRADSHYVYYLNNLYTQTSTDQPIFRLDGTVGDTTFAQFGPYMYIILTRIDTPTVFNEPTRVLTFKLDGIQVTQVRLSKKFGPISGWFYGDPPPPWPVFISNLTGCTINAVSYGMVVSVPFDRAQPTMFQLFQNYPNPFNPSTTISFNLPSRLFVSLKVFDLIGREVAVLVSEEMSAGSYLRLWNANGFAGGSYFYKLRAGSLVETKKLILLR